MKCIIFAYFEINILIICVFRQIADIVYTTMIEKIEENKLKKILIADDEELIRWSLGKFLEKEGYSVDSVMNGNKALQMLEENNYDVVVTDLEMPEIGGIEILRSLEKKEKPPGIIIISSYFPEKIFLGTSRTNFLRFINKPFNIEDVVYEVKQAIELR